MKKNFKFYSLGWILLLGLFNLIAFITPALPDTEKYTAIVPKDSILYDSDGSIKEIVIDDIKTNNKPITIANNTNQTIKYSASTRTTGNNKFRRGTFTFYGNEPGDQI